MLQRFRDFPAALLTLCLILAMLGLGLATPDLGLRLPLWDEASHGFAGVAFFDAWRGLAIGRFLHQLQLSAYWPPAYALLESLVFLVFGPQLSVARTLALVLAALNIGALYLAVCASGLRLRAVATTVAGGMLLLSPGYAHYAVLSMLEIPGIFVNLIALVAMLRYLQRPTPALWRAVCWLSTLLFFTKYNYAIMWIGALVLWQLLTVPGLARGLPAAALRLLRRLHYKHGVNIVCGLYALALTYVAVTGGGDYHVFGQTIVLHKVTGNPLFILVAVFLLGHLLFNRQRTRAAWRAVWSLPEPWRSLTRCTALPIALWLINPQNFATFLKSVINESKRESLLQIFTFYPRALVFEHSYVPALGVLVLAALGLALLLWRRLPATLQFTAFFTALSFAAVCLHPNLITRYLVTVLPFLFLLAGLLLAWTVERWLPRDGKAHWGFDAVCGLAIVGAALSQVGAARTMLAAAFAADTSPPGYNQLLDAICARTADAAPATVIGYGDLLNPAVVDWHCYAGGTPFAHLPQSFNHFHIDPDGESVASIVDSGKIARYFVVAFHDPKMLSDDHIQDFKAYQQFPTVLAASPRFQREAVLAFPELALDLTVYGAVALDTSARPRPAARP